MSVIGVCLLGLIVAPKVAWPAQWSRGECIHAVHQKLGTFSSDRGGTMNKAAVRRCMKHGPGDID
jgi:hypothetical protein